MGAHEDFWQLFTYFVTEYNDPKTQYSCDHTQAFCISSWLSLTVTSALGLSVGLYGNYEEDRGPNNRITESCLTVEGHARWRPWRTACAELFNISWGPDGKKRGRLINDLHYRTNTHKLIDKIRTLMFKNTLKRCHLHAGAAKAYWANFFTSGQNDKERAQKEDW